MSARAWRAVSWAAVAFGFALVATYYVEMVTLQLTVLGGAVLIALMMAAAVVAVVAYVLAD